MNDIDLLSKLKIYSILLGLKVKTKKLWFGRAGGIINKLITAVDQKDLTMNSSLF